MNKISLYKSFANIRQNNIIFMNDEEIGRIFAKKKPRKAADENSNSRFSAKVRIDPYQLEWLRSKRDELGCRTIAGTLDAVLNLSKDIVEDIYGGGMVGLRGIREKD